MWLISLLVLVSQRDLGSGLLFFGLFLVMLYVSTERPGWLVVGGFLFAAGVAATYFLSARIGFLTHVRNRFDIWLHPMDYYDRTPGSFQLVEGLFGMSWGGLIGRGFGEGRPARIPFAESDFIMAAIGEELGLAAVMAIILLYGLLVERGLRTALIARDSFGKLMAMGLAVSLGLQVFTVVGGVTRLIPLTGLTTPFLSYGGSSLVANWVIVALLLRISDHARRPLPDLSVVEDVDEQATQVVKLP
jgi:cell division protein FtsW (lipid II flippase)